MTLPPPTLTVVLPFSNRRTQIEARYSEITAALTGMQYEIIAVDDGSIDGGFTLLRDLAHLDPRLRIVRLRRPFGLTAALAAGMDRANGTMVVTLDADGLTDPQDIPAMLDSLAAGADLVCGRRDVPRSLPTRIGNWLISRVTGVPLHDYGCPLKAYNTSIVREMKLYGDSYRLAPALASWHGARIAEVPVRERPSPFARQGAGFLRVLQVLFDLITAHFMLKYTARPMHAFGLIGGILIGAAALLGAILAFVKVGGEDVGDRPLLLLALLVGVVGIQLLVLGLLAELMTRVYYEVRSKPIYAVREEVNALQAVVQFEPDK